MIGKEKIPTSEDINEWLDDAGINELSIINIETLNDEMIRVWYYK